jgi:hypothetical protein
MNRHELAIRAGRKIVAEVVGLNFTPEEWAIMLEDLGAYRKLVDYLYKLLIAQMKGCVIKIGEIPALLKDNDYWITRNATMTAIEEADPNELFVDL